MNRSHSLAASPRSAVRYFYLTTVFLLTLTGFGQMPVFKRYYIADVPGLGWLAEFFVTHYLHYLGAIVFLGLVAYIVVDHMVLKGRSRKLTKTGWIRCFLLAIILLSGGFLVIRNFSGSNLSATLIILLDLSHLGSVVAFLLLGAYCLIFRKKWTMAI